MNTGIIKSEMIKEIRSGFTGKSNIYGVFGFGSFFRSEQYDDVDVLVVAKDGLKDGIKEYDESQAVLDEVGKKNNLPIEMIFLTFEEYESKPLREMDSLTKIYISN